MNNVSTASAQQSLRFPEGTVLLLRPVDRERMPTDSSYVVPISWPVFAWRVLAPKMTAVKGDPLQRAILRLARAGVTRCGEMADVLDTDSRLIDRLVSSFKEDELLNNDGTLAAPGKALLLQDEAVFFKDEGADLGWIFRDAITGDVFPHFHRGSIVLDRAAEDVAPLPFNPLLCDTPTSINVAEALRLFQRLVEQSMRGEDNVLAGKEAGGGYSLEDEFAVLSFGEAEQIKNLPRSIRIVSNNPERISIPVWFAVRPDDPEDWHLISGFSEPGMDYWLEKKFSYAAKTFSTICAQRSKWLASAQEVFPPEPTVQSEELKLDQEMAFLTRPELAATRGELARARRGEALFLTDPENLDTVLSRYYKVVEAVTAVAIAQLPDRIETAREFEFQEYVVRQQAEEYCRKLGLTLPSGLVIRCYIEIAKKLGRRPTWNPRVNALFLLFHAGKHPESKLREAFSREPEFLTLVVNLTADRNAHSGHHSSNLPADENELVRSARMAADRITSVLGTTFFSQPVIKTNVKKEEL